MCIRDSIGNDDWTEAWCIAWYAARRDGVTWVQHSGSLHGFRSDLCFDPKAKVGAIALINGVGDAGALAMELGAVARERVIAAPQKIEPPAPLPEAYRPLVGLYFADDIGAVVRLEWRDGKLVFVIPGDPPVSAVFTATGDPDTFAIEPGVRQSGERAVFRRLSDGRVASVFFAAGTYRRLDPVREG